MFVLLCIDFGWKPRADADQHCLRSQEREIVSEMALMELKLEGTNLVMQENITNIRDRGRLAGAGVCVTGHLLWTLPPHCCFLVFSWQCDSHSGSGGARAQGSNRQLPIKQSKATKLSSLLHT